MPINVLLADDHLTVTQSLRAFLEREGFRVVGEAADGREAVRLARALGPDVAVLDVSMPLLNGVAAAREIQRACPGTRTILLTMREKEVLQLVAEGKTTKEIAALLRVSVKTVESHRTHVMRKLDIHETASLVRYAVRRGLIEA